MKEKKVRKAVKAGAGEHLKFKEVKQGKRNAKQETAVASPNKSRSTTAKHPQLKKLSATEQSRLITEHKTEVFKAYVRQYHLAPQVERELLKPENFEFFRIYNHYHCLRDKYQIEILASDNPKFIKEFQKKWIYSLNVKLKADALRKKQTPKG